MEIFDGVSLAKQKEVVVKKQVADLAARGQQLVIAAILFSEDQGSVLYTRLKQEAAERVGIMYRIYTFSLRDEAAAVQAQIVTLNQDPTITGIIIQKPWRHTWETIVGGTTSTDKQAFTNWWGSLVSLIKPTKDVDGLHPGAAEIGRVLPATCQAVLDIVESQQLVSPETQVGIIGKSDLLGLPLFTVLQRRGIKAELLGKSDLDRRIADKKMLFDMQLIVSATGRNKLITGELIAPGTALIDVGEPKPDVDRQSVADKASFLTPVPGGVGPMTVVCLLENAVKLATSKS